MLYDGVRYKIGKTINVEQRVRSLKTANPNIILIAYGEGNNESFLHDKYALYRYVREWFNLERKHVQEIIVFFKTEQVVFRDVKTIITFGKYKGLQLSELLYEYHVKYMKWYLKQEDISIFWKELFEKQIERVEYLKEKYKGNNIKRINKSKKNK